MAAAAIWPNGPSVDLRVKLLRARVQRLGDGRTSIWGRPLSCSRDAEPLLVGGM